MADGTPFMVITVTLPGSQGTAFTRVDPEDYHDLVKFRWRFNGQSVTREFTSRENGRRIKKMVRMHREITKAESGMVVDHINRNPLDNRRANLRVCSQRENTRNTAGRKRRLSKYKGVCRIKGARKHPWRASIQAEGVHHYLGTFATELEAAKAYNVGAHRLHGEFACLNDLEVA